MSVMNQSAEDQMECPLCMEPLEVDDLNFYPCTCGYQICRFCWNRIREGDSGLCPACRKAYPENPADFTPLSQEQVAAIKTEKKAREQKRRNKTLESRKALANVRVVQNNLVFVVGLPVRLADPETLKRQEYFGKYGKIHKVVINQSTTYAGSQGPSASAYVTYVTPADALRAIQGVNNVTLDGRILKASLGTTKYCAHFMKNQPCPKVDCMYLHDLGDSKASFSKEEMHAGLHQVYERMLHNQLLAASQPNSSGNSSSSSTDKGSSKDGNFIPSTVVTSSNITIVNSNKSSKKEPSSNGSSNCSSLSNGNKEAWPSLGSSPPNDSPHRKQTSPKLSVKSQQNGARSSSENGARSSSENGARSSSESSSPTQPPTKTKHNKENHTDNKPNKSNKDNSTNNNKKSKAEKKQKNSKEKESQEKIVQTVSPRNELEELPPVKYLPNELEELESDRHSLLDESDHSLLDDDIHGLLEANSELMLIQRRNEMLSGLADNHLMQLKPTNIVNGFGLMNDRQININQSILEKEHRTEMMMRQNELLARQHAMVDPKHYLPSSSIALETNELLGANFHHNPNMLTPFGMRMDHSHSANPLSNSLSSKNLTANNLTGNPMGVNSLPMSVNGLGGNNMGVNSLLNANSMGMNTLGTNNMGLNPMSSNSLGVNSMGVNSLGANPMGVNSMNANSMGVNSLSSNHMGVNSLSANMGVKSLASNSMGVNSMANSMGVNSLGMSAMGVNSMGVSAMGVNSMSNGIGVNSLQGSGFMMPSSHMLQNRQQSGLVNGFDSPSTTEVRYGASNMDKFFTDFHKAQQLRQQSSGDRRHTHTHTPDWLDHEHKQRMNNNRVESSSHAAGDADDDLDFDPFKETQKAMAEMLESEMLENNVNHSENLERVRRLPPPGFSHMNAFGIGVPRAHTHVPSYSSQPPMYSDWTQLDPAIMSASFSQPPPELLSRLSQLSLRPPPAQPPPAPSAWPPGFSAAPAQTPAECIDAK